MIESFKLPNITPETLTGSIVSFNDEYGGLPLKSCTSLIAGYQEGSGTPSPQNVRPLHAFSSASLGKCDNNTASLWNIDNNFHGDVEFNQLAVLSGVNTQTSSNVTFTKNNDNSYTISGTANGRVLTSNVVIDRFYTVTGHKYLFNISESITPLRLREQNNSLPFISNSTVVTCSEGKNAYFTFDSTVDISGTSFNVSNLYINIFDLTQMFGSTIADYIYSLETQTAGAGVAFFKALYPNDYYPYNAGTKQLVGDTLATFTFGQSIYQGYIDWKRGVVVGTWVKANTSTMNWYKSLSGLFFSSSLVGIIKNNTSSYTPSPYIKCSVFECVDSSSITGPQGATPSPNGVFAENTEGVVYFNLTSETTIEGFKSFMSDKQFIYELATPIEIPLGGINLLTQQGVNNIFCDTGNTEVKFLKVT